MNRTRFIATTGAVLAAAVPCAGAGDSAAPPAAQQSQARCEAGDGSIQYRAYLPDHRRFLFVSVKVLKGAHPSVFVIVDKDFDQNHVDLSNKGDPLVAWWLDRTKPMSFSSDQIKIGWQDRSGWRYITSLVGSDSEAAVTQPIRGLVKTGDHYEGIGSPDNNTYAFQSRIELSDFGGDEFSVFVPAVTFDGVRVAAPEMHFTDTDEAPDVKC